MRSVTVRNIARFLVSGLLLMLLPHLNNGKPNIPMSVCPCETLASSSDSQELDAATSGGTPNS